MNPVIPALVLCIGVGGYWLYRYGNRHWARDTIREFEKRFPTSCVLCSYHRYGVQNGHTTGPVDAHKNCPEAHLLAEDVKPALTPTENADAN